MELWAPKRWLSYGWRMLPVMIVAKVLYLLGDAAGWLMPVVHHQPRLFFFCSLGIYGGVETATLQLLTAIADTRPVLGGIFYYRKQADHLLAQLRAISDLHVMSIPPWLRKPLTSNLTMGFYARWVNRHPKPVVLGCNNIMYYQMLRFFGPHVRRMDLNHVYNGYFQENFLPYVGLLDARLVTQPLLISQLFHYYRNQHCPPAAYQQFHLVENMAWLAPRHPQKPQIPPLQVLYVGRGSAEKRVHLFGRVASACHYKRLPIEFKMIGPLEPVLDEPEMAHCQWLGCLDDAELRRVLQDTHVMLHTAAIEGMPLSIMEAMSAGVVPVATNVGGVPCYIQHGINGLLLCDLDEGEIVYNAVQTLQTLLENPGWWDCLSQSAFRFAQLRFNRRQIEADYRRILFGEPLPQGLPLKPVLPAPHRDPREMAFGPPSTYWAPPI